MQAQKRRRRKRISLATRIGWQADLGGKGQHRWNMTHRVKEGKETSLITELRDM